MNLLDGMATYVRIVEAGSMAAAARQLHLSPAAVSRQLTALEAELGAPLLRRTTRELSVTDVGKEYYERCLRLLRDLADAQTLGRGRKGARGLLTVSAPVTFGLARISPHLPALLSQHRGLKIDLRLEDHAVDLVGDGVDVAIRAGLAPPDSGSLVARQLLTSSRVLVASPHYLQRRALPRDPDARAEHDLLCHLSSGGGALGRWTFTRGKRTVDLTPTATLRCSALAVLREAAVGGAGIGLFPEWLVADDIAQGRLRVLLEGWRCEPVTVIALYRSETRDTPRVRLFCDHLEAIYRREAPGR